MKFTLAPSYLNGMDRWIDGSMGLWINGLLDCWIVGEIILLQSIDPIIHLSITPFAFYSTLFT